MATAFTCPACSKSLKLAQDIPAGQRIRCPKCAEVVRVPGEEAAEPEELLVTPKPRLSAREPPSPAPAADPDDAPEERPQRPAREMNSGWDEEDDRGPGLVRNLVGIALLIVLLAVLGLIVAMRWKEFFPD